MYHTGQDISSSDMQCEYPIPLHPDFVCNCDDMLLHEILQPRYRKYHLSALVTCNVVIHMYVRDCVLWSPEYAILRYFCHMPNMEQLAF